MNFYLVSPDIDDIDSAPVMAKDVAQAADLYVQACLEGRTEVDGHCLRNSRCIYIDQFVAPEGGAGLMKDTISTSIPMTAIQSWKAHLEEKAATGPGGP